MTLAKALLGTALLFASVVPSAGAVYDNAFDVTANNGNCAFSTTCASVLGVGDLYAAQEFTLKNAYLIGSASFSELDFGKRPTDVNWGFLAADGAGGLPGTIVASGTDAIKSSQVIGSAMINGTSAEINQNFFSVGPVFLAAGSYYLALQAISPVFNTYLGQGVDNTGAATSTDGGVTWSAGYEGIGGVAVGVYSTPEPAGWAILALGVGSMALGQRRRRVAGDARG